MLDEIWIARKKTGSDDNIPVIINLEQVSQYIQPGESIKFIRSPDWKEIAMDGFPEKSDVYLCDHSESPGSALLFYSHIDKKFFLEPERVVEVIPSHYAEWKLPRAL